MLKILGACAILAALLVLRIRSAMYDTKVNNPAQILANLDEACLNPQMRNHL